MSALKLRINRLIQFLEVDIWSVRLSALPKAKAFLYKIIRVVLLALKGFQRDDVAIQASALTFLSTLSVVPILAMAFGVAKGFGFEKTLKEYVIKSFAGQEEVMTTSFDYAQKMLDSTKGGLIAGIGLLVLFYSVMRLLHNVEIAFDKIWEIKKHRSFVRKLTDYLSIILVAPILVLLSSSATVFISTQIVYLTDQISLLGAIQPLILFGIKLIPYTLIWILFTLTYMIMPNTRVTLKSGLIAGIIAGTVYQLTQWGYINFQVGVSKYNAIYGSFAALPLFLIWMQLSWLIVLLGAEISFAHQNVDKYQFDNETLQISPRHKKIIALLIVKKVIHHFETGDTALNLDTIARQIEIPVRFVKQIVDELLDAKILSEVNRGADTDPGYQPAIDIHKINIQMVIDKLESRGLDNILAIKSDELDKITTTLNDIDQEIMHSKSNKKLLEV
ncbi:MAG: YihY/virulence factor BrkB family protein [Cyclobacteriaceae bacterium]